MPIEDRNLKPGTRLVGRYHKESHVCEVIEGEDGKLRYRLADGLEFKSPSAAGMAITGKACNGWAFWSIEAAPAPDNQPKTALQEPSPQVEVAVAAAVVAAKEQAETPATPIKKPFFRLPNQKGAPEGKVRWYCHECGKSFLAEPGDTPESCPQGHKLH